MNKFWVIWNEAHGLPHFKHSFLSAARQEAERLARMKPGETFHVLEWSGSCVKNDVSWVDSDSDIPF